ncbi:MAG: DnaD domain protein [Erysipelotrichaceae bacterium]|nr:DnaD domain protein [Erysipelotrichaceae bacterium]
MNSIEDLLDYDCIDYRKLLVIKAQSLKLTDQQVYLLIIMITLMDLNIKPITPAKLSQFCQLSLSKIDEVLISLVDMHLLNRINGSLDLKPLYKQLLNIEVEKTKDMDLISMFEDAFGRSLSQREIEIINSFKSQGFSDMMIMEALNEAVKSGVVNFRYIEKILDNWQKYGVKKRYAPKHEENQTFDQKIKDYKWWDNE